MTSEDIIALVDAMERMTDAMSVLAAALDSHGEHMRGLTTEIYHMPRQ